MERLSSLERILRTIRGEPVDRVPTFDILHNIDLIERLGREKLTPHNGEDLLCKAAGEVLDLVRHFAVPDRREPWFLEESGFVYRFEWWTGQVVQRPPLDSTPEVEDVVKRDIELILRETDQKKVCHAARQHVRLFDEGYEYMEEVKEQFGRLTEKLAGTVMLPPEDVAPIGVATERLGEAAWWYLYSDAPDLARRYLDTLTEYQLRFIDVFACAEVCPLTQISVPIGTTNSLLYSPVFNRREVLPREKVKIERWKRHGYTVLAFLDSYKWPVIDDYIDAGVSEIHPLEPYCQMEMRQFRERYPLVAAGQPIDCAQLLAFGTPAEVREAVVRAIRDAEERMIIIGSTSEIHPQVRVENALALYEAARSYPL